MESNARPESEKKKPIIKHIIRRKTWRRDNCTYNLYYVIFEKGTIIHIAAFTSGFSTDVGTEHNITYNILMYTYKYAAV